MSVASSSSHAFSFSDDKTSRRLAVRVRKAYKTVLRILEHTKLKKPRRVALLCSELVNSKVLASLQYTSLFADHVSYHVSSGKFRKNSYRILLRVAPASLSELERLIKQSNFLFDEVVAVKGKNALSHKKPTAKVVAKKATYAFNALEDLERIKQLVIEKTDQPVQTIIENHKKTMIPVKRPGVVAVDKKKVAAQVQEEPEQDLAKSVTDDDASVFSALNKERKDVDVALGECKMFKRGVVMLGTHIPNIVWKKVYTKLGLQVVAKQYVTAMYAPVIASPAEAGGDVLDSEVVLNHANQLIGLHNRKQSQDCLKLALVGEPFRLGNSSHWWYLALPLCVVNHASFRFGSWNFTKPPRTRTAHAAEVVE